MPNTVRLPRLLDDNMNEVDRLHPAALSADLEKRACSTAQMTLPDEDPRLDHMPFAELFTAKGSLGIFRVYDSTEPINGSRTYTLRHAIDTLRDSVWRARTDFSGTVTAFLTALLSYQTVARWQLGTCADAGNYKRDSINYDHLDALLDELREAREGYYFTYDFSTTPWTLNFVAETGTVDAELRQSRNLNDGSLRRTRKGMANRLHLAVKNGNSVAYAQYDDATSQAEYGVLEGTATVDGAEVSDPAAWAAQFFQDHGAPIPSANFDGWELVKVTGEPWDALDIGKTARVAVGREGFPISLPIEALRFENLAGDDPEKVRAELNRRLPKFSEKLAQAQRSGGGAGRRSKENEEKIKQFETYEIKNDEMIGMVAHAMGVVLDSGGYPVTDPQTGKLVYDQNSAAEIFTHLILSYNRAQLVSAINNGTGDQVSGSKVDLSAQGNVLIQAINRSGGSSIKLSADVITLDGETVASSLLGQDIYCHYLEVSSQLDVDGNMSVSRNVYAEKVYAEAQDLSTAVASIGPADVNSQTGGVTIPWSLLNGNTGTPINFNIAATQYFQDQVAAATQAGKDAMGVTSSWNDNILTFRAVPSSTKSDTVTITGAVSCVYNSTTHQYICVGSAVADGEYVHNSQSRASGTQAYDDGFSDGEDQFTLASITLQGTSETVYVDSSSGTDYYEADTSQTYYEGNGGSFYVQGTAYGSITPIGNRVYFQSHSATETPTGTWYTVSSGATSFYLYQAGTAITGLRNPATTTRTARGSAVTVTPIKTSSKKTLASATRYQAGSTVANTYYTKS